jgi:hypothetical protein
MELNYFISQSELASRLQRDKWLDTSSISSRNFIRARSSGLTGISGDCDFSLFFTFDKNTNEAGTLLSNNNSQSNNGFSLNFNNNNELFLYSNSSASDCYTFSKIRLAKKNCIGVIKSSKNVTILNYDLDAKSVYKDESYTFANTTNLSGGQFAIGYNSIVLNSISISGISGTFDQLVCFSGVLPRRDYENVFSGFLPLQGTFTNTYTKISEIKQLERKNNSSLSQANAEKFIPFLEDVAQNYIPTNTGNYVSYIFGTGSVSQNKIIWSGDYSETQDLLCYYTGSLYQIGGQFTQAAIGSNDIIFNDQIYYSMNDNSERTVSHLFSFYTGANINVEDFFTYNKLEKYKYVTTSSLVDISTAAAYRASSYMEGAINEKTFDSDGKVLLEKPYVLLQTQKNKSFADIGIELTYDSTNRLFLKDKAFVNGYNVYWGYTGKVNNYIETNNHISFPEIDEHGRYPCFYDKTSNNADQLFSSFTFSTGYFPRGASIVFVGENLAQAKYRQRKQSYYETSSLHLAHGKRDRITLSPLYSIYNNEGNYWTDTKTVYDI